MHFGKEITATLDQVMTITDVNVFDQATPFSLVETASIDLLTEKESVYYQKLQKLVKEALFSYYHKKAAKDSILGYLYRGGEKFGIRILDMIFLLLEDEKSSSDVDDHAKEDISNYLALVGKKYQTLLTKKFLDPQTDKKTLVSVLVSALDQLNLPPQELTALIEKKVMLHRKMGVILSEEPLRKIFAKNALGTSPDIRRRYYEIFGYEWEKLDFYSPSQITVPIPPAISQQESFLNSVLSKKDEKVQLAVWLLLDDQKMKSEMLQQIFLSAAMLPSTRNQAFTEWNESFSPLLDLNDNFYQESVKRILLGGYDPAHPVGVNNIRRHLAMPQYREFRQKAFQMLCSRDSAQDGHARSYAYYIFQILADGGTDEELLTEAQKQLCSPQVSPDVKPYLRAGIAIILTNLGRKEEAQKSFNCAMEKFCGHDLVSASTNFPQILQEIQTKTSFQPDFKMLQKNMFPIREKKELFQSMLAVRATEELKKLWAEDHQGCYFHKHEWQVIAEHIFEEPVCLEIFSSGVEQSLSSALSCIENINWQKHPVERKIIREKIFQGLSHHKNPSFSQNYNYYLESLIKIGEEEDLKRILNLPNIALELRRPPLSFKHQEYSDLIKLLATLRNR